ncbi:bifunctional diaminohydroxyphosphoribosylaminopyrimidine deaminase/5-amino-6-(5-phosphoribosylamino)uracil reductase RibD [Candidatus Gracilibacteria bacterium]|nr:bifunctional diaminohydroxyphosphoribosylaminopyrimidine deaminase/5-amino-6-(5-phosphoribosylamino)uracil reductase RibD [Candidatus Gracilibacteria bacterium]
MDKKFMRRAIELAMKAEGMTSPNPLVGAVIVKGGHIIAEGYHKKAGEDHAEVIAIRQVMEGSGISSMDLDPSLFKNAELYVTLEPCAHVGKTPSCAKLVADCGFKKVHVGMKDPFEKVNGKGIRYMRKAGSIVSVLTEESELANEVRSINQPFIKWAVEGIPYVVVKAGMSLDGKIATAGGESQWITGEDARDDARMERSKCDAVLVGAGTVKADDPELAAHGKFKNKDLLRVVIGGKLDESSKVFRDENVLIVDKDSTGKVNLKRLLKSLAKKGVQSVFVEGGAATHGAFFDAGLVDKAIFYIAPRIIGGTGALSAVGGEGVSKLSKTWDFGVVDVNIIGQDLKVEGLINFY